MAKKKKQENEKKQDNIAESSLSMEPENSQSSKLPQTQPVVEKGTVDSETDIFDDMLEDIHESTSDEPELQEELIKEQGIKEDSNKVNREELKETILQKASLLSSRDTEQKPGLLLNFLSDEKELNVFIGRKKNVFKKFGYQAAFFVGKVSETEHKDKNIFLDGLNPHVVFVCGARGSGKCLTGDTLITLEDGRILPIKELEHFSGKIFGLNHGLKIEPIFRENFFKRTVEKILKIRLKSGKEIKLTPEHPLLTIDGWKNAQELFAGNRIGTPRILPAFGNFSTRDCEVKLLAYLIAEGHLGNHFVLFSNTDKVIQNDFFENIFLFDNTLKIKEHSNPNCFRVSQTRKKIDISDIIRNSKGQFTSDGFVVAQKNSLARWLILLGLYEKRSKEKFVPLDFLQLKKEQLSVFLNRLFSCDGSIYRIKKGKNWCIDYSTSSEKLGHQIQNLLLRFGILSTFRTKTVKTNGKNFKVFELVIYGENVLKFISEIGFFGAKHQKQEIAFTEMTGLTRNPNNDTIPKEIWNKFKVSNRANIGKQIGYSSPKSLHNTVNYSPSRQKLLKLALVEENKGVQLLAQADIFWDEIVEKTEIIGKIDVYDITVPVYHNFVANDIIVHNSYFLGVIAEELALKNKNIGTIIVDPVGVFWSMRFPNKEEKEIERLEEWGLKPNGLNNLKVFIPKGMISHVPESTFDAGFAMQPSLLESEDWALTFGIDRFSVTGLLLEKVLKKVETGFKEIDSGKKILGKKRNFSLDDIIFCLERDDEINSREKGFKVDSVRALVSRFEAAKAWGIFDEKGTPLSELSRAGQLTILDTSFLDDTVTSLVVGIIARRLLSARKLSTRKEAAQKFKSLNVEELLELEIPPTWLVVDEAHTLIPSGNLKTPASKALTEYVKQGRRPGCSLVFATQQPSAIDSKVLSQLDIILVHKLVFDDDVKAVYKRMPTLIPNKYKKSSFVKTLPIGVALTGDRQEETSRAFIMKVRPRFSQHEGRDIESVGSQHKALPKKQVLPMTIELIQNDIIANNEIENERIRQLIETMNAKYSCDIKPKEVFAELEKNNFHLSPQKVSLKKEEPLEEKKPAELQEEPLTGTSDEIQAIESTQNKLLAKTDFEVQEKTKQPDQFLSKLVSLPVRVSEKTAKKLLEQVRQKKIFGIFGKEEQLSSLRLKNHLIWRIEYDVITRAGKEFVSRNCFVDSITGEFVHFSNGSFVQSNGLKYFFELNPETIQVLNLISKQKLSLEEICQQTGFEDGTVHRCLKKLAEKNLLGRIKEKDKSFYFLKETIDLPPKETEKLLESLTLLPFIKPEVLEKEQEIFSKNDTINALGKLWKNIVVKKTTELYRPVWTAMLSSQKGQRTLMLDAVTGKIIN